MKGQHIFATFLHYTNERRKKKGRKREGKGKEKEGKRKEIVKKK